MKILVTGGAGFIGSHLCRLLLSQGHTILVLDDLSTGSYENLDGLEDGRQLRLIVDSIKSCPEGRKFRLGLTTGTTSSTSLCGRSKALSAARKSC